MKEIELNTVYQYRYRTVLFGMARETRQTRASIGPPTLTARDGQRKVFDFYELLFCFFAVVSNVESFLFYRLLLFAFL